MSNETWRPLGVDSDDEVAEYDALHDGVPSWMSANFWDWVKAAISKQGSRMTSGGYQARTVHFDILNVSLTEQMAQRLQIAMPNLRGEQGWEDTAKERIAKAMKVLLGHGNWLQIADYLLAQNAGKSGELDSLMERSKSAWMVGGRSGKPGLVRRVPLVVQVAADSVIARAGRAGVRLAKAWEELYGLAPNPSEAYRLAILAVEDASVPVVSPSNKSATLGTVLKQMEDQQDWQLPLAREHKNASSGFVLVGMIRMLWHGQHDRHGGQPSAPGNVSVEEARVAVSLAVTLVDLFDAGFVGRRALS